MTIGWILEGDRERFLAARERTPDPHRALPLFQCPFCKLAFRERPQLSTHLQTSHTVERPFMLLAGVEPGTEDVLRKVIGPTSLEVFNCTELAAGFDGATPKPVQAGELARKLSGLRRVTVQVRIANAGDGLVQPIVQEYRLRILAPDDASLSLVDEMFINAFGSNEVRLEAVGSFYEATRQNSASEYAEALADYVRAALIKDGDPQTGVSNRLHHYREIQNGSLSILTSFERPVAHLLCSLIRFGLNDFSHWHEPSGFAELDKAYSIIGPLALNTPLQTKITPAVRAKGSTRLFVCPVDIGTDTVTRLAKQADELSRWGLAAEEQFSGIANQHSVDTLDSAKIRALWALTALRLGATESAERALRLLDGDPTFGAWASDKLAEAEL